MTAAAPLAPPARAGGSLFASVTAVTGRNLRKIQRTPQIVIMATVQSIAFLLIFRYVFGGAIPTGGLSYVDYMVPGLLTVALLFSGMGAAVAVADDLTHGVFDRLRSLPIPRSAVVIARVLADTALITWCLILTTAVAFAIGFRIHGGAGDALAAFGLCVLFGFAFIWVFVTLGLYAGNAQAAQGLGFLVLPLSFASSAYVPVATMPGWLQGFAAHQPVTVMINTIRCLTQGSQAEALLGHSTGYYLLRALLWSAGIIAVFAPLAFARYRRR
ncbi:ABC transporter permease [Streptomyces sp. NPDC052236]|uniref:ABC transporter permease n=1 Tax=Streptomyces sp. NPDC052236 TaxID=3365686 RepID=UPI0037D8AA8B